jgi:hypothetical protein
MNSQHNTLKTATKKRPTHGITKNHNTSDILYEHIDEVNVEKITEI